MKSKTARKDLKDQYVVLPSSPKVYEIGFYYGFAQADFIEPDKTDHGVAKQLSTTDIDAPFIEEKAAQVRRYFNESQQQWPIMTVSERPASRRKDSKFTEFSLDIIGTPRSVADATLIQTAYACAKTEGYSDLMLELNTVGDRESFGRYSRELASYFRKHINELSAECRQLFKKGPMAIINCDHEKCQPIKEHMPVSMGYLSEPSRTHFMEVLEFLETLGMPYSLNNSLIQESGISVHTQFQLKGIRPGKTSSEVIADGLRWSGIAKKMGLKKDVQSASATLYLPRDQKTDLRMKKLPKPVIYFMQMGQEAKLKSLTVIEILRLAKIPVYHSLTKDKLTAQLGSAEYLKVPFVIIMGQKESLDNTVLVRDMNNRSQDTVRLTALAEYLEKRLS